MGVGSAKKSPAKSTSTPTRARRSASKALKQEESPPAPIPKTISPVKTPTQKTRTRRTTPRDAVYSHHLPTAAQRRGNGRFTGRNLIVWNRPRMAEKLLLHISYECFRNKIHMPWDAIAHRLHPGSTGAAVAQHFNKVRQDLIAEGHVVPPVANKPGNGSSLDPEIRGYVRMHPDGPDRDTTRPVKFSEHLPDAKFNLPDSFGFEDDEEENEDVMNVDGSVDFTDEESEVPDTPTPVRQPIRNAETAQKFHAELYDEAEDHMNGLPGDNLRHGNFHSNKAAMDGNDIHPDFRAWAPFGEGYQMGFAAGGHDQLREHDGWTHSPYASSHGSQQLRGMSAPMFGYGRPGGYMGMPMRMTPGFLPYASNLDGYSIAPQRPSSPAGVGKPVDSPRGETKLETPPSDGAEPAEAPFDDLILPAAGEGEETQGTAISC